MLPRAIKELAEGNYAKAYALLASSGNEAVSVREQLRPGLEAVGKLTKQAHSKIKSVKRAIELNRSIQFIFWDSFLVPLDLSFYIMKIIGTFPRSESIPEI